MIKTMLAAFIVPMAFILGACGVEVTAGTVVDKQYKEAWSEEVEVTEQECDTDTYYTGTGKNRKKQTRQECEEVGTGEYETVEHDAEYTLTLEDKESNKDDVSVTEDEYNSVEIGDYFDSEA